MANMLDDTDDCLVEVPVRLPLTEIERLTRIVNRARQIEANPARNVVPEAEPEQLAKFARFVLSVRRRREAAFPLVEFGEPAWDMLLDLYVQHVEGKKVSVSSLCAASAVPATTALRWIGAMVRRGHFVREHDPNDKRQNHIGLAPSLLVAIEGLLADMRHRASAALR